MEKSKYFRKQIQKKINSIHIEMQEKEENGNSIVYKSTNKFSDEFEIN